MQHFSVLMYEGPSIYERKRLMNDEKIVELFWNRSEKAIEETDKLYGKYFSKMVFYIKKRRHILFYAANFYL